MITFSKLGQKGNLGNQLFQIASTIGIATKNGHTWFFPEWEYENSFIKAIPTGNPDLNFKKIKEQRLSFYEWEIGDKNYDLEGWMQSEEYFDSKLIKEIFSFNPKVKDDTLQKVKHLFYKKTILISIRRGDFVYHPMYFQLSFKYYFLAIIKNFPDWKERNLIFTSDDIDYCKHHFGHLRNSIFLENKTPMEQLIIGSNCTDFVISNSTFSWWIAWLGEKKRSKIIRPIKNFSMKMVHLDDSDYYPKRWIMFDHRKRTIPPKYFKILVKGNFFLLKKFLVNKKNGLIYKFSKISLIHKYTHLKKSKNF